MCTDKLTEEQILVSRGRARWGDCYMSWPLDWKEQVGGSKREESKEELKQKIAVLEKKLKKKQIKSKKIKC